MAELQYSAEAINTLQKFYRCDTIVYVEGDDDEMFWATIFKCCADLKVVTQSMGGSSELDKQIERIVSEDLKVLAARDADFLICCNQYVSDPRVIYTYGHSIENTLYTEAAVAQIARFWCRDKGPDIKKETSKWMEVFHRNVEGLAAYDAANFLHDCGLSVAGDNVAKFAHRTRDHEIDPQKIQKHLALLTVTISDDMRHEAVAHSNQIGRAVSSWIRGHFLASAVLKFVSSRAKAVGLKGQVSYEALYVGAMQFLESSLNPVHPHYEHYKESTLAAIQKL